MDTFRYFRGANRRSLKPEGSLPLCVVAVLLGIEAAVGAGDRAELDFGDGVFGQWILDLYRGLDLPALGVIALDDSGDAETAVAIDDGLALEKDVVISALAGDALGLADLRLCGGLSGGKLYPEQMLLSGGNFG